MQSVCDDFRSMECLAAASAPTALVSSMTGDVRLECCCFMVVGNRVKLRL